MQNYLLIPMLCLALVSQQSFVDTAPISEGITTDNILNKDSDVQQLENLKKSIGRTIDVIKSEATIHTNVNKGVSHSDINENFKENGELIARLHQHIDAATPTFNNNNSFTNIQTDLDIPLKGIHKSILKSTHPFGTFTRNDNRRSSYSTFPLSKATNSLENVNSFSGIQYSPLDMAEYVFWTGDENGVTLSIEELLQEGLMTREEAISFLQEIKYNLDYLKHHYTELGLSSQEHSKDPGLNNKLPKYIHNTIYEKPELNKNFDIRQLRQEASQKRVLDSMQSLSMTTKNDETIKTLENGHDLPLDKLVVADVLYTEYSLEEVIYQLAKVMFTQSLTRDSAEAQQALQKFTNFLEVEAEQGHISKALEKKVLDVLIASLSDTLTDHPELLTAAKASSGPTSTNADGLHFIKQILELIPNDKPIAINLIAYKQQKLDNQNHNKLNESNKANHLRIGFDKYNNP